MELRLTGEQEMLVETVRRFVREEVVPLEAGLDPDADRLPDADRERLVGRTIRRRGRRGRSGLVRGGHPRRR